MMWIKAVHRCKALCSWGGLVLVTLWMSAQAVPIAVDKTKVTTGTDTPDLEPPESADTGLHYDRYLREVVEFLEKDKHFREKLQNSDMDAIKQGQLAKELDFVGHHVRTQLDELKRQEVSRLRTLIKVKHDMESGADKAMDHKTLMRQFEYLNHKNPHTFEVDDLDRLIKSATSDLDNFDKERHDDFKKYEMSKEHQRREKLKDMDEEHRKMEEMHYEELKKKHAEHPKVHHPGSQDQLKEVWEETDHLDPKDFNPKTFFNLHDTNGDGFFDEQEMEALFTKELEKLYDPKSPDYDGMEMEEERLRMREHVIKEVRETHPQRRCPPCHNCTYCMDTPSCVLHVFMVTQIKLCHGQMYLNLFSFYCTRYGCTGCLSNFLNCVSEGGKFIASSAG